MADAFPTMRLQAKVAVWQPPPSTAAPSTTTTAPTLDSSQDGQLGSATGGGLPVPVQKRMNLIVLSRTNSAGWARI